MKNKTRQIVERKKIGNYSCARNEQGGVNLTSGGLRLRGFYVPPADYLIRQYNTIYGLSGQKISKEEKAITKFSLITMISYYPVWHTGKRNVTEGLALLGLPHKSYTPEERIAAIKFFWPARQVKHYYYEDANEHTLQNPARREDLPSIRKFKEQHSRVYRSIARSGRDGLKNLIEEIYPPGRFPDLYLELRSSVSLNGIDTGNLAQKIIARYTAGLPLTRTDLQFSPLAHERKIGRQIRALARGGWIKGAERSYVGVIRKLTGLKKEDILIGSDARPDYAILTQDLTHFLLLWAFLTKTKTTPYARPGPIYRNGGMVSFTYDNSKEGRADLRIGNKAIEVKTGVYTELPSTLEDITCKYSPGKSQWHTGEIMDSSLVVVHEMPERVEKMRPALEKKGIGVLGYEDFHKILERVVEKADKNYRQDISKVKPRIHNLTYLLQLHADVSLRPLIVLRKSNIQTRLWIKDVLKDLIRTGEELNHGD